MTERNGNLVCDLLEPHKDTPVWNKTAFDDGARTLTYGELDKEARRFANSLKKLGLRREDRIALLMLDTVDWPVVFLGAAMAGVVPVALNTLLVADLYSYMLNDSRVRALFVSEPLYNVVEPILDDVPSLEHIIITGGQIEGRQSLEDIMTGCDTQFETIQTSPDEVAFWLYSSGSTGMPKGTMHVHASMGYTARTYGANVLGIRPDDICYSAAKFFFAYGLGNAMSFPMTAGATTILMPGRPTPDDVLTKIRDNNVTLFFGVPTLYGAILADKSTGRDDVGPALRLCVSAGEALPADIGQNWSARFGADIIDGIGSTEMLHIFLSNRPEDINYGTSGKAFDGYALRLADEDGNDVPEGEVGELLVNGASAANGYWNQRERSRMTFEGRWTRTGDKYTCDADGYYHYCGRTDDMFKVSGIWVSPFEVESALVAHDAIIEAAVVGHDPGDGLLKPKAFVVATEGTDTASLEQELKDHVKSAIGKWKYPRWIEFVTDLPKTATGKIQRFRLRG